MRSFSRALSTARIVIIVAIVIIVIVGGAAAYLLTVSTSTTSIVTTGTHVMLSAPIKIGVISSLTGPYASIGTDQRDASELAAKQINDSGGVYISSMHGYAFIKLYYADQQADPGQGVTAMNLLVYNDNVDLVVGGVSSAVSVASEAISAKANVPFIITGATSPTLTTRTDLNTTSIFLYGSTDTEQDAAVVSFVLSDVKPLVAPSRNITFALLREDSASGESTSAGLHNATSGQPINFYDDEVYPPGGTTTDYHSQLQRIKSLSPGGQGPDVLYIDGGPGPIAEAMIEAVRDVGLKSVLMTSPTADTAQFYQLMGQYGNGEVLVSTLGAYAPHYSNSVDSFELGMNKTFGMLGDVFAAGQYDGIKLAAAAIQNAGSLDKNQIILALHSIKTPQISLAMQNQEIQFNSVNQVLASFIVEQLRYNSTKAVSGPVVVWPDSLKTSNFTLPSS